MHGGYGGGYGGVISHCSCFLQSLIYLFLLFYCYLILKLYPSFVDMNNKFGSVLKRLGILGLVTAEPNVYFKSTFLNQIL